MAQRVGRTFEWLPLSEVPRHPSLSRREGPTTRRRGRRVVGYVVYGLYERETAADLPTASSLHLRFVGVASESPGPSFDWSLGRGFGRLGRPPRYRVRVTFRMFRGLSVLRRLARARWGDARIAYADSYQPAGLRGCRAHQSQAMTTSSGWQPVVGPSFGWQRPNLTGLHCEGSTRRRRPEWPARRRTRRTRKGK